MTDLLTSEFIEQLRAEREAQALARAKSDNSSLYMPVDSLLDDDWLEEDLHPWVTP